MCGRFTYLYTWRQLHRLLGLTTSVEVALTPRYNVAPTQQAPVVRTGAGGQRECAMLRWGLIPAWAQDAAIASSTINARAESLTQRPAFREAARSRRCVVPVSGFYEWARSAGSRTKQPHYVTLVSGGAANGPGEGGSIMLMAGLWESWRDPKVAAAQPLETFTIITTPPNALMARLHDRMPAILTSAGVDQWLAPGPLGDAALQALLTPYPEEGMVSTPVSTRVNSPRHDDLACLHAPEGTQNMLFPDT